MPRQGKKRIEAALTNLSVIYKNEDYIASDLLKDISVMKDTDSYYVYASEFRIPETERANHAPANVVTWELSTAAYYLKKHSLKDYISPDDRDNTDAPIQLDRDTTEYLTDKILLRQERETAKLLFTTTTFSNNTTLNTATSWEYNTTTSAPIQNVLSATTKILKSSGKMANGITFGWDVFAALKENNNVYGRIQYTDRQIITKDLLTALFDMRNVWIGSAIYDQGLEGGTESQTTVWGTDALVGYWDPNPGHKKITTAVMMRSRRYGKPFVVRKWFDDDREADAIEVTSKFVPKAVATACAYLFKTVTLV